MTRFPVCALRSVEIGTPDIDVSERFYTKTWGLRVVERRQGSIFLRASGSDHHVLVLSPARQSVIYSATFRAASAQDLARIAKDVESNGGEVVHSPRLTEEPGGGSLLTIRDPQERMFRFVYGDTLHEPDANTGDRPVRLAHVNLNCAEIEATQRFFERALGFKLTDRSKMMAFVRCNSDHHTVVLAEANNDTLNHIAFLMPDFDSVMRGAGRMIDDGYPLGWGVGRHGPGNNIFAYFVDPTGFVIEYTSDVLQVDDSYVVRGPDQWVWPPGRTDLWGVAPPKSETVKAAQTAIPFAHS
jgi:catechol 2,3-dioxygenase-like lactoylglutathione lyase family enzyme